MYMINFLFETTILLLYISYIGQIGGLILGLVMREITTKKQIKYFLIPLGFLLYIRDCYRNMEE